MTDAALRDKFLANTVPAIPMERARQAWERLEQLPDLGEFSQLPAGR
ncbi:MAG: hypothetical protein AB7L76_08685 [Burkholderiaceae bacterium]